MFFIVFSPLSGFSPTLLPRLQTGRRQGDHAGQSECWNARQQAAQRTPGMPEFVMRRAVMSLAAAALFKAAPVSPKSLWPEAIEGDFSFVFWKHGRVDPACLVHLDRSPRFLSDRVRTGRNRHGPIVLRAICYII
jgi:hypothetical protein